MPADKEGGSRYEAHTRDRNDANQRGGGGEAHAMGSICRDMGRDEAHIAPKGGVPQGSRVRRMQVPGKDSQFIQASLSCGGRYQVRIENKAEGDLAGKERRGSALASLGCFSEDAKEPAGRDGT